MFHKNFSKILLVCTSLLTAFAAVAGFDVTKMTTVVDDQNGSYTVTKNGRLDEMVFVGGSTTEFNEFHPGGENEAAINGVITKQTNRGGGQRTVSADGDFTIESLNGQWEVSFSGLNVQADENGAEITGAVTVNEETYDANELPNGVGKVLRRVFWLTRR